MAGWVDKITKDLYGGKCHRAFPTLNPRTQFGDTMLFSDNYGMGGPGTWSVVPRRFMCDGWITNFCLEHNGYDIKLSKPQIKALKVAYSRALTIEFDRYQRNVRELS